MNTHDPILVVAAHPDDEVLGCGGTIARSARQGHDVYVAVLGEGMTSRHSPGEHVARDAVEALQACTRRAAGFLGVRDVFFYDLPDNRFDTVPLLDAVKPLEGLVARLQPGAIYTHHGGDLNIDHAVTHRAVLTATRPMAGSPVRALYAFETFSSTEWAFAQFRPPFQPNVFVDIEATLDGKAEAMAMYESEARDFPHPRSGDAIRAAARRWGSVAGCGAAEAFELIRLVVSNDA